MRFIHEEILINAGSFYRTQDYAILHQEIVNAIKVVVWPTGSDKFTIYPEKNRNGVTIIKNACVSYLEDNGWLSEQLVDVGATAKRPGKIDVVKSIGNKVYAVEWETGNISSSHRALNKLVLGLLCEALEGGTLILPTRELYQFLTDRVGNYPELAPYFPVYKAIQVNKGILTVIAVEHDATSLNVPPIAKGTDGRALR